MEDISKMYDLESLVFVVINKESFEVTAQTLNESGHQRDTFILSDGNIDILISKNENKLRDKIEKYVQKYPTLSLKNIGDDIAILCEEEEIFMLLTKEV